ncbi:MAG TPA: hypothetical protein VGB04_15055 [Allosphingosinicella sp.]|jgi:hypothetical protein
MPPIRRRLRAAAFVISGLAAAGAPALAQNETSNTIGPPQLKDFSLPGQRTTPPATTPPPPATTPPVAAPRTPPAPSPDRPAAEPRPEPRTPRADTASPASEPTPPPATAAEPAPQAPSPTPLEPLPQPIPGPEEAAPAAPAPAPAEAEAGNGWLWPAAGGVVALLLAALFLLRRRRAVEERESARDSARDEIGGALFGSAPPETAPPEPEPVPLAEAPAAPRPWLELDIAPERAAATEAEVYVRYALTMTNRGDADARNIRIDPRLFNAGAEGEMMDFFQGPIHDLSGSPHIAIPPGGTIKLTGQVAMPNAELREIELAGRRVFVPMVAINVAYDWAGGGTGRTSRSWLVGREAETPQEKMGPFRLDLGPRIYRSVGRREARLVMV